MLLEKMRSRWILFKNCSTQVENWETFVPNNFCTPVKRNCWTLFHSKIEVNGGAGMGGWGGGQLWPPGSLVASPCVIQSISEINIIFNVAWKMFKFKELPFDTDI